MNEKESLASYRLSFENEILENAELKNCTPDQAFLEMALEICGPEGTGDMEDPMALSWNQSVRKGRKSRVDGYGLNHDTESSICLFVSLYGGPNASDALTRSEAEETFGHMLNFLEEVYEGLLSRYCDPSEPYLNVAEMMSAMFREGSNPVRFIKLFLFTDRPVSQRYKATQEMVFHGIPVRPSVYALNFFQNVENSATGLEPIDVNFNEYGVTGIQAVEAHVPSPEYESYLAVIPGKVLARLYGEYQSRLLEGNVRAFLSGTKVNRGIRDTINNAPSLFFAYNNGVAVVANEATMVDGRIVSMKGFQVINGGQTTVSLANALAVSPSSLDSVYVPAKITIIHEPSQYADMVAKISQYANTQNRVSEADLSSNNTFNMAMERASKKYFAPLQAGKTYSTYWFYERARGMYNQLFFGKKKGSSEFKKTQEKFPKAQRFRKEELAKAYMAAILKKPQVASKGGQKCTVAFMKELDAASPDWEMDVTEFYFHKMVCLMILYRSVDRLVNSADWYKPHGFKAAIVTYSIARFISEIEKKGLEPDFEVIWKSQCLSESWEREFYDLGRKMNDFFENLTGNANEQAKSDDCWEVNQKKVSYTPNFKDLDCVISPEANSEIASASHQDMKVEKEANVMMEIYNLGFGWWMSFLEAAERMGKCGPNERSLLLLAAGFCQGKKTPSDAQLKLIWQTKINLENSGVYF